MSSLYFSSGLHQITFGAPFKHGEFALNLLYYFRAIIGPVCASESLSQFTYERRKHVIILLGCLQLCRNFDEFGHGLSFPVLERVVTRLQLLTYTFLLSPFISQFVLTMFQSISLLCNRLVKLGEALVKVRFPDVRRLEKHPNLCQEPFRLLIHWNLFNTQYAQARSYAVQKYLTMRLVLV